MVPTSISADSNHSGVTQLKGLSIRESAGSPAVATIRLRKASVSGQILMVLELAENESATLILDSPIPSEDGVYVQVVAGTVEGVIYQA